MCGASVKDYCVGDQFLSAGMRWYFGVNKLTTS